MKTQRRGMKGRWGDLALRQVRTPYSGTGRCKAVTHAATTPLLPPKKGLSLRILSIIAKRIMPILASPISIKGSVAVNIDVSIPLFLSDYGL